MSQELSEAPDRLRFVIDPGSGGDNPGVITIDTPVQPKVEQDHGDHQGGRMFHKITRVFMYLSRLRAESIEPIYRKMIL